jgi:hypothetical protein
VVSVEGALYGIPAEAVVKIVSSRTDGGETGGADAEPSIEAAFPGDAGGRSGPRRIALVVSRGGARKRLHVDGVLGVRRITADRIELVPGPAGGVRAAAHIEGETRFVTILAEPAAV